MYMSNDPGYLSCTKKHMEKNRKGKGAVATTCRGTLTFHVINIRTDIEFVLFGGGFETPCFFARSRRINFANPNKPLYGHISSIDSTGTSVSHHLFSFLFFFIYLFFKVLYFYCQLIEIALVKEKVIHI